MKIKTLIICVCLIVFGGISCFAAADVSYDAPGQLVRISGTSKPNSFVTIVAARSGREPSEDSADENVIYKTILADGSGKFEISIELPDFYTCGKYIVSSFDDKLLGRSVIGYIDIETGGNTELPKDVNSAQDKDEVSRAISSLGEKLALDKTVLDSCGGVIAENVLMRRPSAGYDAESFIKTYYLSEGIAQFVSGKIGFDELCMTYCAYTDVSHDNDWSVLSDNIKSDMNKLMQKALASEYKNFAALYEEMKYVAQLRNAGYFGSLQDVFLQLAQDYNVNLSDYYDLKNDYYREEVFRQMYRTIKNTSSMDEVISLFQNSVKNVGKSSNSDSAAGGSSGGGASGGSSFGGGGVGVAVSVPKDSAANNDNIKDAPLFSDISGHWAEKEITEMKNRGIIDGFEDGSFRPETEITRAQFVKILSGAFQIPKGTGNIFGDVLSEKWYAGYIYGAFDAGVINGVSDTEFAPESAVTRQDAGVIIYRMLKTEAKTELSFDDAEEIAPYAQEAIASLSYHGIFNGYDGRFNPNGHLTRAEAAALLNRAAEYIAGGAVE